MMHCQQLEQNEAVDSVSIDFLHVFHTFSNSYHRDSLLTYTLMEIKGNHHEQNHVHDSSAAIVARDLFVRTTVYDLAHDFCVSHVPSTFE
jgi:hypothetical protein